MIGYIFQLGAWSVENTEVASPTHTSYRTNKVKWCVLRTISTTKETQSYMSLKYILRGQTLRFYLLESTYISHNYD